MRYAPLQQAGNNIPVRVQHADARHLACRQAHLTPRFAQQIFRHKLRGPVVGFVLEHRGR